MGRAIRSLNAATPLVIGLFGLIASLPDIVVAQTATASTGPGTSSTGSGELETIVVTAQKRVQNLNDVDMAITAVSGDALTERGVTDVQDLTKLDPSFQFSQANTGTPIYTIRGVGYFDQSLAASPTVSVYQDEVAYSYPSLTKGALLDVERVEILKGPQGTLYGENSTGGAINFVAAKPTDHYVSGLNASFGRFGDDLFQGFISGPIAPTVNARLAVSLEEGGAWQQSYTRNDTLGDKDVKIARLLVDWIPNDAFKASLNLNGWTDDSQSQANQLEGYRIQDPEYIAPVAAQLSNPATYLYNPATAAKYYPTALLPTFAEPIAPGNDRAADWVVGTHPQNREHFYQTSLRLEYSDSDALGFTSLTSYERYGELNQHSDAALNVVGTTGTTNGTVRTFSQELRVHGVAMQKNLNWLVGANYQGDSTYENDYFNFFQSGSYLTAGSPESIFPAFLPFTPFNNYSAGSTDDAKTYSAFGNVDYHFLEDFGVHAGVRYTESKQNFSGCAQINDPGFLTFLGLLDGELLGHPTAAPVPGQCDIFLPNNTLGTVYTQLDQHNVPWRVGLDWKPAAEDLLYVDVSKGYKAGASPTLGGASYIQFKPVTQEELLDFEVGAKTQFLEHRLELDATFFHYDYTDKQFLGRILDPLGVFGAIQTLVNIPKSEENGAEFSAIFRPIPRLTLNTALTYIDSKVTSNFNNFAPYITGPTDLVNFKGEAFPFTPKWSANYGARYEWPWNDSLAVFVAANGTYQSATVAAFGAAHAAAEGPPFNIKGYGLLDLSAGVTTSDKRWSLEFWGRNVANTYYWNDVFYVNDTTVRVSGMPSTFGVTVRYRD